MYCFHAFSDVQRCQTCLKAKLLNNRSGQHRHMGGIAELIQQARRALAVWNSEHDAGIGGGNAPYLFQERHQVFAWNVFENIKGGDDIEAGIWRRFETFIRGDAASGGGVAQFALQFDAGDVGTFATRPTEQGSAAKADVEQPFATNGDIAELALEQIALVCLRIEQTVPLLPFTIAVVAGIWRGWSIERSHGRRSQEDVVRCWRLCRCAVSAVAEAGGVGRSR